MNNHDAKILLQLRLVRSLSVGAFGILRNEDPGLKSLWESFNLNALQGFLHKLKSRCDSARVILQTVEDGGVAGPAVVALVQSALNYAALVKGAVSELTDQKKIEEFSDVCFPLIQQFNAQFARTINGDDKSIMPYASRLPHALKKLAPPDVAMYYCIFAACEFAEGIDFKTDSLAKIVRELRFPPEYQQAGLSILNYFSVVLEDKYPDIPVSVSIQQDKDKVTLLVTLPDGTQEIIEKALTEYGLVVAGKIAPQSFMQNQIRALALEQKLEMAQMEVRQTRDLLRIQEQYSSSRIESLEREVKNVYELLGRELTARNELQQGLLQLTLQGASSPMNQQIVALLDRLSAAIEQRDEHGARIILEDINQADPDIFTKISIYIYSAATSGVIGNFVSDWVKPIINSIVK